MQHRIPHSGRALSSLLAVGLALVASGAARAQTTYKLQPILRLGDAAGDLALPSGGNNQFWLGGLTDAGQLLIDVGSPTGSSPDFLVQFENGKFTTIAAPGADSPDGTWPAKLGVAWPMSMNQSGDVVFAGMTIPSTFVGTYLWEAKTRKVTPLALKEMPATGDLTFTAAGGWSPAINNRGDVVIVGTAKGPSTLVGGGIFLRGRDGSLQPVLLPRQELPGGGKIVPNYAGFEPSLNDAGQVAFIALKQGQSRQGAFLWEQGMLTALVLPDAELPGGGKLFAVSSVTLNKNGGTLLSAGAVGSSARQGLYRVSAGKLAPIAVPGQALPGGGTLKSAVFPPQTGRSSISPASETGEHVFNATLEDGSTAVYRIDAADGLSLVLKSGTTTDLGTITKVEPVGPPAINSQGQVALVARIDGGVPTVLLLTPATP